MSTVSNITSNLKDGLVFVDYMAETDSMNDLMHVETGQIQLEINQSSEEKSDNEKSNRNFSKKNEKKSLVKSRNKSENKNKNKNDGTKNTGNIERIGIKTTLTQKNSVIKKSKKFETTIKNEQKSKVQSTCTNIAGSKKGNNRLNANHLLNFTLPMRSNESLYHDNLFKKHKIKKQVPRNKESFLKGNFRFIILPMDLSVTNISSLISDPDTAIEWRHVLEVIAWSGMVHPIRCPICLDDPILPKITNCGHIFCWICILQYMSFSANNWRRCPMCLNAIKRKYLKTVKLLHSSFLPPSLGDEITFQGLYRKKKNLFPERLESIESMKNDLLTKNNKSVNDIPLWKESDNKSLNFYRIMLGDKEYKDNIILNEEKILNDMKHTIHSCDEKDNELIAFIDEALNTCKIEIDNANESNHTITENRSQLEQLEDMYYIFYQCITGEYIILHPFNMRCLYKEFYPNFSIENMICENINNYTNFPNQITGKILEIEHITMTIETRKRYRFLNHLPLFSDVYICEIDLTDISSLETANFFKKERILREEKRLNKIKQNEKEIYDNEQKRLKKIAGRIYNEDDFLPLCGSNHLVNSNKMRSDQTDNDIATNNMIDNDSNSINDEINNYKLFSTVTESSGYYPALGDKIFSGNVNNTWYKQKNNNIDKNLMVNQLSSDNIKNNADRLNTNNKNTKRSKKISLLSTSHHRRSYN